MPVTRIVAERPGKGGSWSLDRGFNLSCSVYLECTPDTDSEAMLRSLGLPVGATYRYPLTGTPTATNPRLFLDSITIDEVANDGCSARLTALFVPADPQYDEKGPPDPETGRRDPFSAPPRLRGRGVTEEFFPYLARDGKPILNSAREAFDNLQSIDLPVLVYEVERLERTFNDSLVETHQGRVNDAEWFGWPPGSALCNLITSSRDWNDEVEGMAWTTTYEFAFKRSLVTLESSGIKIRPGWKLMYLDQGFSFLNEHDRPEAFLDDKGVAIAKPKLLNGNGHTLPAADDPVFLEFDVYPTADFSLLNMPPDLFTAGTPA